MALPIKGWRWLFVCLSTLSGISHGFINFLPGSEYEYKIDGRSSIKSTGNFHMKAKVGFINVHDREDSQEVFLRIHTFIMSQDSSNPVGHDVDFSKWFSFNITRDGKILSVLYDRKEDGEVLAFKKGVAAMFASRLHKEDEKTMEKTSQGWQYHVQEFGHEGHHDATYLVQSHPDGKMFTKTRPKHPLPHAKSKYTKRMYYSHDLGHIHTVHVNDEFYALKQSAPGYDPHKNQRPTKAVNGFSDIEYPEMSGFGNGKLEFITKHELHQLPDRKWVDVVSDGIAVHKVKRKPIRNITPEVVLGYIKGNLTIMRQQPEQTASNPLLESFHRLMVCIELLTDGELEKLADHYLSSEPKSTSQEHDRNHIMDAIAATGTNRAQIVLADRILDVPYPDKNLVLRLLVHIISMDEVPHKKVFSKLVQLAFQQEKSPVVLRTGNVYHRILLTLGSIVRKLYQAGRYDEATHTITKIENMLGYHDPYTFRQKRSVMSKDEILLDDTWRVNLLGALGNARMKQSYEFIISHINSSNSQWIKRAGVHALRGYHHQHAARMMLERAMYDENPVVRYEALIQYQSHPKAKTLTPYNNNSSGNSSIYYNPWDIDSHRLVRQKRGFEYYNDIMGEGLGFSLSSPSVDWKKMIGTEKIGASFGVLMKNLMDLKIALLSGHAIVDIHDEAFARVHLGIIGETLDFFLARVCFKGSIKYEINILQEFGIDSVQDMVKVYDSLKNDIVRNIKEVVEFFKGIITGKITMESLFNDFKKALEDLPQKVLNLGKRALESMSKLDEIDTIDLPPFVIPVKKFINKIVSLYNDIKKDVMAFYNQLFETVTVIIPRAGKQIYTAINDVINAFKDLQDDPQTAVQNIGRGVINIGLEVKMLIEGVKKIKDSCFFLKDEKPYWFDLKGEFEQLNDMRIQVEETMKSGGQKWLQQKTYRGKDPVAEFTKGRVSMMDLKQKVINELKEVLDEILNPLNLVKSLGGKVFNTFTSVFDLVKTVKEAFNQLKEGYGKARDLIDRLFGPKCHKQFPKTYRTPDNMCSGSGTYPSSLGKGREYSVDGVDILIQRGQSVVAPFPGYIRLSPNNSNEVILKPTGGSLKDIEIIITNINPLAEIEAEETLIQAGSEIGKASGAVCEKNNDHIHFAMRRTSGGIISPAKYLPPRMPGMPAWVQECDDYKLVWKFDVVAEGSILGTDGEEELEEEPERTDLNIDIPSVLAAQNPSEGLGDHAFDGYSMYSKTQEKGAPDVKEKLKGDLKELFKKPAQFLEKYSIRKLKMGGIINLLDMLEMDKSKQSLSEVMLRIKEIIDNKPCFNPNQMTDDQLRDELTERGKSSSGSRQMLIDRLTARHNKCPTMTLNLPKNVYCTFDENCLGLECCVSFKLFVFLKTYKLYARLNPCDLTFVVGVKGIFEKRFDELKDIFGGFEIELKPGVKIDLVGELELIIRCKVEKSETGMLASVSAGFCSPDDNDNCLLFIPMLDEAVLPVPICNADGSLVMPNPDYKALYGKQNQKKKIEDSVKAVFEKSVDYATEQIITQLGIPGDLLDNTPPCQRPEILSDVMLRDRLAERGLNIDGTKQSLIERLTTSEKSCTILHKTFVLPTIKDTNLNKMIYVQISDDCLHLQACLDVKLTTPLINVTKSFHAYVRLDACNFILVIGFERYSHTVILIDYVWGKEEQIPIGDAITLKFSIYNNANEKVFVINLGAVIKISGNPILDRRFIEGMKIPIPICDNNFTLPGKGSIADFANAMGGQLSSGAFDILLQKLGLKKIFTDEYCQIPETPSEDCPWNINIEKYLPLDLHDEMRCSMVEGCFGLQCCVDFQFKIPIVAKPIKKSVVVFLEFDPCTFVIEVGFGTFRHTETLLTYNWGKPSTVNIGNGDPAPITITYTISQYNKGFIIDVNVLACIPIDGKRFCFPDNGFDLMKDSRIPTCDVDVLANITDLVFSLEEWKTKMGIAFSKKLASSAVRLLLDELGITPYLLDKRCDIKRAPYSPNINGWRNDCPKSVRNLPKLPEGLVCHLGETCSEINCCFNVMFLDMSFHAFLNINTYDFFVEAGIEDQVVKYSLLDDKMDLSTGLSGELKISDFFLMEYGIRKTNNKFLVDLSIKVCFERGSCQFDFPVMIGTELPQVTQFLDIKEFSLSEWALQTGVDLSKQLRKQTVRLLLEQLGIADQMLDPPCDRNSLKYQPTNQNNWKNDCPVFVNLPEITVPAVCYIPDYCTGIDCCLYNNLLDISFNAYLYIDTCNYIIYGAIEKLKFQYSILEYEWGMPQEETLNSLLTIRYQIDRLVNEKLFIVDVNISVCLQGLNDCELDITLFRQTKLQMPLCDMQMGFKLKDFSLTSWIEERGGDLTNTLTNQLMDYLGITDYLSDDPCSFIKHPFKSAMDNNGWKNDCPMNLTLLSLPDNIGCYIPEYCTGIICCMDVPQVKTSFQVYLLLDNCNYQLSVGVEKINFNISLIDYQWGQEETVDIGGIFKMTFTLADLEVEKQFIVNMKLSACFTVGEDCGVEVWVLRNTRIHKIHCDWDTNLKEFNLEQWLRDQSVTLEDDLSDMMVDTLLEKLSISSYLQSSKCDSNAVDSRRWNNECPIEMKLSTLPPDINCNIPPHCTGVSCCVYVPYLRRSVHFTVDIDACKYIMTVGIETRKSATSLLNYEWGKLNHFTLNGVVRLDYIVYDLKGENELLLSLNVSVCLGQNSCQISLVVLNNIRLSKQVCVWNSTVGLKGFSLDQFMKDESTQIGESVSDVALSKLFEILGVSRYLLHQRCNRNSDTYNSANSTGWKFDCPINSLNVGILPSSTSCRVPDFCTGIDCCIDVPVIGYTFNIKLYINTCELNMMVSIENLAYEQSLLHYQWGKREQFNMNNIIGIGYVIDNLEGAKQYLVSLTTKFCLDAITPCETIPILQNVKMPKLECHREKDNIFDFSLSGWLLDNAIANGSQMSSIVLSRIFDEMGISVYLNEIPCDKNTGGGWKNRPQNVSDLPSLPDDVSCYFSSTICGIYCCLPVPILKHSFEVFVLIDPCDFILSIGIEQYQFNRSLISYKWGTVERFTLRGIINADFVIDDLSSENVYLVSLNLSVCLDAKQRCMMSFPVLINTIIPKPVCYWDNVFATRDISISKWLDENRQRGLNMLTSVQTAKLFEELDISRYLKSTKCLTNRYISDSDEIGWSNDCPLNKDRRYTYLPDLPENITCHIGKSCTSIDCCVHVELLNKSFSIGIDVNMCDYSLTTTIENLVYSRKLFDFNWGEVQHFYMKGVIRVDYILTLIPEERLIEMSVNVSICLEKDSCWMENTILKDRRFPQPLCNFKQFLQTNKFSLIKWKVENRIPRTSILNDVMVYKLLDKLDLTPYLKMPECDVNNTVYLPSDSKHWKKECVSGFNVPALPEDVTCHWSRDCTTIDCCLYVNTIRRSVNVRFNLDICNLEITFTIERLSYTLSLFDYKWGSVGLFHLKGLIQMRYRLENKAKDNEISIDLSISICFENDDCVFNLAILQEAIIAYTPCGDLTPFKGVTFDFWSWMESCSLQPPAPGCSIRLEEPISDMCRLNPDCLGINCCIRFDTYYIKTKFNIDNCNNKLTYSLENKEWDKTLNAIRLDTNITENIGEAISISYNVGETDSVYIVTLRLKVCVTYNNNYTSCKYWNLLEAKSFVKAICNSRRKRRSVMKEVRDSDFKTGLQRLLKEDASNEEIQAYIDELAHEEILSVERNLEPDVKDGGQVNNPRSALKTMGSSNPATLLYTTNTAKIDVGVDGELELVKTLGRRKRSILTQIDQVFMSGDGLTGKGVELLGAKLANMTMGEIVTLIDAKNIDPEMVVKLVNDLRNLALDLYADIIDKVVSGEITNVFKSSDVKLEGDFSFPRQQLTFFEVSQGFLLGGFFYVDFRFSAGCTYGMKIKIGAKIMKMSVYGEAVPYGGLMTTGEISLGFIIYASLRLEGYILTTSFPTRAEIGFSKFPLDIGLTMDVELIPLKLRLLARVLVRIEIPHIVKFEKILFSSEIWEYTTPSIRSRLIDYKNEEKDTTAPTFSEYTDTKSARRKRAVAEPINTPTRHCSVRQLPDRDYTEPAIEISVRSEDDKSQVRLFVTAGTKPGLSDALRQIQLGGQSSIITTILKEDGVPIYFTVVGKNSEGASSTVTCSIPTYDVTLPGGRLEVEFITSSNPGVLKASVVVYEDSELVYTALGVGYGRGIYGDEIVRWTPINMKYQEAQIYNPASDPHGHVAGSLFAASRRGRLIAPKAKTFGMMNFVEACMMKCLELPPSKCLSINYDYGSSGQCELVEAIEGHAYKLAVSGDYVHAERLGIGLAHEFIYKNKNLLHDHMYYFNMDLKNVFGYRNIISTQGVLIDITPPVPGEELMNNSTEDDLETIPCINTIPSDRPEWNTRCIDQSDLVHNHRIIVDELGSRTIFNGHEPLVDDVYFRGNRIISANWDGIHDKESRLLGYSFTAGHKLCEELIHPHHDPHRHLYDESEWTHTGVIKRDVDNVLSDGVYYVTVRALNKVEYGGPLATTICHSTPYIIDNSKPFIHEVFNVEYDEETKDLSVEYNSTDLESGIREVDICLGETTKDCFICDWKRYPHSGQIIHNTSLPGGVPVWTKIRAWNHVQLASIKSSDRPLIIDITPPIAGQVFDGPIYKHDQSYTKYNNKLCANWIDFYDPESGIASFKLFVRSMETDDYLSLGTDYDHGTHQACVDVNDQLLQHNKVYYMEVWAFNDGHIQLNTSAKSNGVIVDLTVPVIGQVVDGLMDNFTDLKYSAAMATISTQWRNHTDPESSIKHYEVKMTRKSKKYYEIETVRDWHELDNSTEYVEYHNFHLKHGDIVRSKLRTTNGALGQVIQETDGYIVDLTPPRLIYLNDGNQQAEDIQYQYNETVIQANFKFIDDESGVDYYKYQVYQTEEGSKVQIFPEIVGTWELIKDGSADGIHVEDQQLISGVHYSVRVVAVNGASSVSTYDTNGFLIDQSPPTMQWVYVSIFSGEEEDRVDGYVYQADTTGIKATWFAYDDVSGIQKYLVSVGTTPGGGEILDWRSFGTERDGYIGGIQLDVTKDNSPIYYVSVKAKDGAGLESEVYISTPIIVVDDDKTGIVLDGPEGTVESNPTSVDVDYQRETHTVTVQFSGFESRLHGFAYFDWAIGTTSGGEEAQPFLTAGLYHEERDDISGTSGYGQAVVELESGKTYYTTVRGITNNGHVLESVSDGCIVDISPPVIKVNSISGVMEAEEGDNIYQSEVDSIDIKWTIDDPQSGIYNMYYTVGTYPQGTDVKPITPIQQLLIGNGSLPVGQIQPNTDGKPNIVTIWGDNKVGLKGKAVSANLIVDSTPPSEGKVVCPRYIQPHTSLKCSWSGFINIESPIVEFTFGLGSAEGLTDIINPVTLSGHTVNYLTEVPGNVSYEHVYYTIITAKNSVGKTVSAVSDGITIDVTPPVEGRVVELNTEYIINVTSKLATRQLNPKSCDTIDECGAIDAVCQESLSSLSIAWSPFRDDDSDIVRYDIAVGTTPGGGDIRPYFTVPVQTRHLYIKNLMLMGLSKVYVSVKATNGAGLSTVSVSNGVSLSYISQKLEPLSHIGVWDGAGEHGDIDYQTSVDTIQCSWDVTGDPCPVVQYEWAIERIDGLVVQEFTDTNGRTQGVNDQLELQNDERYICLLRVKNAIGFTYIIRSNGVTIEEEPLLPGRVNDGDIEGYDLNFVFTSNKISANWKGFGEDKSEGSDQIEIKSGNLGIFKPAQPDRNQDIEYYEVAVGKDRRFPKTRDSLIPFTNVGLNTSVTFYDLDLVPITATYYFTVRAYSKSMSMAEVTSNGFKIGFNDGVTGGVINMPEFINSNSVVDVQWDGFTSRVGMFMYYLALSSHSEAIYMDCRHFIQVGSMSDNRRLEIFDVLDRKNFGKNTFGHLENLNLLQNHSYYASVIGVDMAGLCKMINHKFHVDITPPSNGKIKIGPYYDMKMAFVSTSESIIAKWKDFTDMDSGLECYRVSLLEEESCDIDASSVVIIPPIEIDSNYTSYTFLELNLKPERVYIIKLEVENKAGLTLEAESAPAVYDASTPTPGLVVDGTNYKMDAVWSRSTSTVLGSILHLPTADGASCPARHILFSDPEWEHYVSVNNYDTSGTKLNIKYRKANVYIHEDELEIKLAKDDKTGTMVSGAYYRDADMNDGGTYELNLRAADGNGKAVTSIIFWDAPVTQIVDFDYTKEPDWTSDVCSCCKINQTDPKCLKTCNCTRFLESKNITKRSADTTISDDSSWYVQDLTEHQREVMMGNNSTEKTAAETPDVAIESQTSCGIQILAGDLQKLVTWCKYKNDLYRPMKSERKLKFDPSVSFNRYTIMFFVLHQDALEGSWCLKVYVNDEEVSDLCGVPHFTTDTKIFMQVRNWKNFLPPEPTNEQEFFNVWTTRAIFKSLIMPPDKNALCRYGKPFRGGTTAIIRFEAGISEMKNSDSIVPFKEVVSPCVPCDKPCDRYVCQSNCSSHQFTQNNISLESLDLQPTKIINGTTKPVPYYLTVKAVLGSGQEAVSSSNGFYIDVTPPVFDEDLMLYIDVDQGNYTPVTYQGSNSTIKSIWSCVDNESMVVEYQWGIGSSPGLLDIQSFISTGENPSGTNDSLIGVLEDNSTYYVTVKCFNGAGLESVFTDMKGVTVLLYPPDIEDVGTNMTAGEPFKPPVTPDNAVKVKEGGTIGCSWTISKDSSLREYDFCVGSSEDIYEDIFPCTWVGYNVSGKVSISDGWLLINDEQFKPIGVYHPNYNDTSPDNASTAFKFEPGRTLFLYMRMCNEARRCTIRLVGSSVVINNNSKVVTSSKGGPLRVNLASNEAGRQKREIEIISIETPTGMKEGQSIILTKMDVQRLAEDYTSDASIDFLSFITNPSETFNRRNNLHRLLVQRLKNQPTDKYFILTSIGHLEIPGPLIVNIKYNPVDMEPHTIPTLLHWNPVQQKWMLSSRSCQTGTDTDVIDETNGEVWIKVCDTWSNGNEDGDSDVYFSKDTLFAVTKILKHIPNTAPTLISTRHMTMMEDSGTLVYSPRVADEEDDDVKVVIVSLSTDQLGSVNITQSGLLLYLPCKECSGELKIQIRLTEIQSEDIEPKTTDETLTIRVLSTNDAPMVFSLVGNRNILHVDSTEPVTILLEENHKFLHQKNNFTWIFGAYDVDKPDELSVHIDGPLNGSLSLSQGRYFDDVLNCNVNEMTSSCLIMDLPHPVEDMSWLYYVMTYIPNDDITGYDVIKLYVSDHMSVRSDVVTFNIAILNMPCINGGTCQSKYTDGTRYKCQDALRADNFYDYYSCNCTNGWSGVNCQEDVNECQSSPCIWPYVCFDFINEYQCACPIDNPNCDSLVGWMIGLIVVAVVMVITLSFLLFYCLSLRRGRGRWPRVFNRFSLSSRTGCDSKIIPFNPTDIEPGCEANCSTI